MTIQMLSCDICNYKEPYSISPTHQHPELELGGVPVNIWTPIYTLNRNQGLVVDDTKKGIDRFQALIPVSLDEAVISTEGDTPLIRINGAYLKDESNNPTGSFKDRGIATLISEAIYHGVKRIAIPSTGNAAISLGYYGNRAGIETIVFIPDNTPEEKVRQIRQNSEIITNSDLIESYEHFFRFCKENTDVHNGFPANNIAYLQGLKTAAYELFMQLGETVPNYVIVPVGSGGNIVGLYYGFRDLVKIGVSDKMPHLVTVQLEGADPITQGFRKNQTDKLLVLDSLPETRAEAIASDTCFNYFKILNILSETDGTAISVTEDEIDNSPEHNLEYSSRSIFPGLEKLLRDNKTKNDLGNVVLIGTARDKGD